MKSITKLWIRSLVFFAIVILLSASGALAVTEKECIAGGGGVTKGIGCSFCVGGKFDLSEVNGTKKDSVTNAKPERNKEAKNSARSDRSAVEANKQ